MDTDKAPMETDKAEDSKRNDRKRKTRCNEGKLNHATVRDCLPTQNEVGANLAPVIQRRC